MGNAFSSREAASPIKVIIQNKGPLMEFELCLGIRVTLRVAVYRLGVKPLETPDQHFFQLNTCSHSLYVTSSLTRGWVRRLPLLVAQSFSGSSPAGLMTMFYSLRFETPPTWRIRSPYLYPLGTGWPSYTPRHRIPFSVASYGGDIQPRCVSELLVVVVLFRHGPHRKRLFHYCVLSRFRGNNGSTELFPSNGCCTVACLHSCCLTVGLQVTVLFLYFPYCSAASPITAISSPYMPV
jgi:hypothetical protein